MGTPVNSRPTGKRYLGNTNTREVHDLHDGRPQCWIEEIISAGHAVVFSPDTLAQANSEGYDNCAYCLGVTGRSRRQDADSCLRQEQDTQPQPAVALRPENVRLLELMKEWRENPEPVDEDEWRELEREVREQRFRLRGAQA